MRRSFQVELQPTPAQITVLLCYAGTARYIYNWGLVKYKEAYLRWLKLDQPKKWKGWPTAYGLSNEIVKLKHLPEEEGGLPWLNNVSKAVPEVALQNLERAFSNYLAGRAAYPKFKSRNKGIGGFGLSGAIRVKEKSAQLPKIGCIRLQPGNHGYIPISKYAASRLTERAGRWFLTVVGPEEVEPRNNGLPAVGIDLGVINLAVLSDGTVYSNAKLSAKEQRKIRILDRRMRKKEKGSKNRKKARVKLARAQGRIANRRLDYQHKLATTLTKNHGIVVLEKLKIKNMTKKGKGKKGLNRVMQEASLGQFRSLIEYKGKRFGCEVRLVNPAYTSQRCSNCAHTERGNRKSQSSFVCLRCGHTMNADLNAALNILVAGGCPDTINACGEVVRLDGIHPKEQTFMKQESVAQQCVI